MTTFEIIFVSGCVGVLIGMLVAQVGTRRRIRDLEFDKIMLLDFNESLIRDRDEIEQRYELETKAYIVHLDSHRCEVITEDDEVLNAEYLFE